MASGLQLMSGTMQTAFTVNSQIPTIASNFQRDLDRHLHAQLLSVGCDPSQASLSVGALFFQVQRRRVRARPRKLYYAKGFECPTGMSAGLTLLQEKVRNGQDLLAHHSKAIFSPKRAQYDGLLNDWGIHHFHLGDVPDSQDPKWCKRTGPLLFALVSDEAFRCICIASHGSWTDKELLQTVHDNWPELLAPYRLKHTLAPSSEYSAAKLSQLRREGVSTSVVLDNGDVLAGPGGGITTARSGVRSTMNAIQLRRTIDVFESDARRHVAGLAERGRFRGPSCLVVRLHFEGARYYISVNDIPRVPFGKFSRALAI